MAGCPIPKNDCKITVRKLNIIYTFVTIFLLEQSSKNYKQIICIKLKFVYLII